MKRFLLIMMLLLVGASSAFALTVTEAVITTQISNREPVDNVEVYPAQMGKLYCFTRVEGATAEETAVEHVWSYEGREMARVTLPVRSARWRTYSSKKILPEWKGNWQVKVVDLAGNELARVPFKVE